jgi:type IV pilus assembly protein PilB
MAAANLLSASAARRHGAVPVAYIDENTLLLAMSDPANVLAVDDIVLLTRLDVRPRWPRQDIAALVTRLDRFEDAVQEAVQEGDDDAAPVEIVDLRESADDAPVIKLVHSIIAQAAERRASDIHFEPQPDPSSRSGFELRGGGAYGGGAYGVGTIWLDDCVPAHALRADVHGRELTRVRVRLSHRPCQPA